MSTEKDDRKLAYVENFEERFIDYTSETDTYEEAYHLAERDYRKFFGRNRYSSYNSFRATRSQRLNRRKSASN